MPSCAIHQREDANRAISKNCDGNGIASPMARMMDIFITDESLLSLASRSSELSGSIPMTFGGNPAYRKVRSC
jgi:hypothetical protein